MWFGLSLYVSAVLAAASTTPVVVVPPKTPSDMAPCRTPLVPTLDFPRATHETVRYAVEVDGLSVGTVDFRVERTGTVGSLVATEYRCQFKIDSLVATLLPADGRAASLVLVGTFWPKQAMSRYRVKKTELDESLTYTADGRSLQSRRVKNGQAASEAREFAGPAWDFVSGFYLLRSLAANSDGCGVIYANQRAHTFWIKPDGNETIMTPVGLKPTRRYFVRFASEKAKKADSGRIWMSTGPERLPFQAEMLTNTRLRAKVHLYETGDN